MNTNESADDDEEGESSDFAPWFAFPLRFEVSRCVVERRQMGSRCVMSCTMSPE